MWGVMMYGGIKSKSASALTETDCKKSGVESLTDLSTSSKVYHKLIIAQTQKKSSILCEFYRLRKGW